MGKLHACLVVTVGALSAACGDDGGAAKADAAVIPDSKVWMDAAIDAPPMFNLACAGNAAPTTATATIALSGFVQEADFNIGTFMLELNPVADATVKACDTVACNGPADGSATTDAAGDWAIAAIDTNDVPLADYLEMTKTNTRSTLVYPHAPFTADQAGIPILTFADGAIGLLGQLYNDCDGADPLIAVAVTDCDNMPITDTANINVTVKQAGSPVATAMVHDLSGIPMAPPQVAGLFLICGVPANDATEIGATYNGTTFLAHSVKVAAPVTTTTQVRPGY